MRVRNKELHRKWHRKAETIKALKREAIANSGTKAPKEKKVAAKPAAAPKAAAPKAAAPKAVAEKPKKAPAKKKAEDTAEAGE